MVAKTSKFDYGSKDWVRDRGLFKNYGITLGEWNEKLAAQNYRCGLCDTNQMRGKNWHTDHNHETGQVRMILCGWCNTALGKFQEDPDLLVKAAIYTLVWNHKTRADLEKARRLIDFLEGEYIEASKPIS